MFRIRPVDVPRDRSRCEIHFIDTVDDSITPNSVGQIAIELTGKFGADRRFR